MARPIVRFESKAGEPFSIGDTRIIPFARSLQVSLPGMNGGLIWNRPVSVLAITADGQEQVLPVPDITRRIQFSLLGAGVFASLFLWVILRILRK